MQLAESLLVSDCKWPKMDWKWAIFSISQSEYFARTRWLTETFQRAAVSIFSLLCSFSGWSGTFRRLPRCPIYTYWAALTVVFLLANAAAYWIKAIDWTLQPAKLWSDGVTTDWTLCHCRFYWTFLLSGSSFHFKSVLILSLKNK